VAGGKRGEEQQKLLLEPRLVGVGGGGRGDSYCIPCFGNKVMTHGAPCTHYLGVFLQKNLFCIFFNPLKVHKNENFFGFDFEFCTISMLVLHK
jgi:hypothetical protein